MTQPDPRRAIPPVHEIIAALDHLGLKQQVCKRLVEKALETLRRSLDSAPKTRPGMLRHICKQVESLYAGQQAQSCRPVLNGTGILLHTNMGRAPLSETIMAEIMPMLTGYTNLELDIAGKRRGNRLDSVQAKLSILSPFESGLIVNNNAAACLLILNTLARGREVIVSRGELVEIGGSFRLPDIISSAGAKLREVGTTNITRISDYEKAIHDDTALIMHVHRSNYAISGHTSSPSLQELHMLAQRQHLPLYHDMGSTDFSKRVMDMHAPNGLVVSFSFDKMPGACQGGIILGQSNMVGLLQRSALYRSLRVSKFPLCYLDRYLHQLMLRRGTPVLSDILNPDRSRLLARAGDILSHLQANGWQAEAVETLGEFGGGAGAGNTFASAGIRLSSASHSPTALHNALSAQNPAVLGSIHTNALTIDLAAIRPDDDGLLARLIDQAISNLSA